MKILVTGGAGYIGSHLVYELIDHKHEVTILDNLSTGNKEAVHPKAIFIEGSHLDKKLLNTLFAESSFDLVVHLSGKLIVSESVKRPDFYKKNNVEGTQNILDAMKEHGVDKIIYSSTGSVYGNVKNNPIPETTKPKPINPYAKTKLAAEKLIEESKLKYIIFRFFNVAGAHDNGKIGQSTKGHKVTHLIPSFIEASLGEREVFKVYGENYPTHDGTCIRDYIHVMDLVEAHIQAIEHISKGNVGIFNLGSGKGFSVKEVISSAEQEGFLAPIKIVEPQKGDPAELVADITYAEETLYFKPKKSLKDMITSERAWQEDRKF